MERNNQLASSLFVIALVFLKPVSNSIYKNFFSIISNSRLIGWFKLAIVSSTFL